MAANCVAKEPEVKGQRQEMRNTLNQAFETLATTFGTRLVDERERAQAELLGEFAPRRSLYNSPGERADAGVNSRSRLYW